MKNLLNDQGQAEIGEPPSIGAPFDSWTSSEQVLRETLAFQKAVLSATKLAMIWLSPQGLVRVFNESAERLLGYSSEEVIGLQYADGFCEPSELLAVSGLAASGLGSPVSLMECLGSRSTWEFECHMIRRDNSKFPALLTVHGLSAENPDLDGLLIIAGDLTKKRQTEEAVRSEKRFSETLMNSSQESIFAIDPAFGITVWNPGSEKTTGLPRASALGNNLLDLLPELTDNGEAERMAALLAGRSALPPSGSFAIKSRSDDKVRHYSASYIQMQDESGKLLGLLGTWHDITNLKMAEERLLIEKEFSEALIRSSNDGIFAIDQRYRITEWNPGVEVMSGVKRHDALGRIALDLHPALYLNGEAARLSEALEGGQTRGEDQRYRLPGKGTRYYSTRYSPLRNSSGTIVGALGIVRDITESKTVETELRRSRDAAETADRAKTRFLANMSHEIRTPMNAIIGLSTILLDTQLTRDQRKYLETVRLAGQDLLAIINQILDFSKLSSSHVEFENLPLNVRTSVDAVLNLVATSASAKALAIACEVDPQVPDAIIGDGTRLRQILLNLLGNAVKFTDRGGRVSVVVKARSKEANLWEIHFAVQDSGIGIPADKVSSLFNPFHQADSSTTRKYGGTGLGLAISKQLAEQMGGKIWVESEFGKGSTFQFTILAEAADAALHPGSDAGQSCLAGIKALVIDQANSDLRHLWPQFPDWLMDVPAVCTSIAAARECGTKGFFDVVIVDRDTPDLSLEAINQLLPKKVPFVLIHSPGVRATLAAEEVALLEEQPVVFLPKPLQPSDLRDALAQIFATEPVKTSDVKNGIASDLDFALRKPLRILVAEDHPVNQMLTLLLLSRLGYKAQVANNGVEVLKALKKEKFDVIFMDLQMPEMDGVETTQKIGAAFPLDDRPWIIALTANAMETDREVCRNAGMQDFVAKPVELGDIRRALVNAPGAGALPAEPSPPPQVVAPPPAWQMPESLAQVFEDNAELGRQLIEMFLEDARSRLASLKAIQKNQKAAVLLHGLQGSFRQMGAVPVGTFAMKLESAAKNAPPEADFLDVDQLIGLCDQVFKEMEDAMAAALSTP